MLDGKSNINVPGSESVSDYATYMYLYIQKHENPCCLIYHEQPDTKHKDDGLMQQVYPSWWTAHQEEDI